jgi:hypothetical protein
MIKMDNQTVPIALNINDWLHNNATGGERVVIFERFALGQLEFKTLQFR